MRRLMMFIIGGVGTTALAVFFLFMLIIVLIMGILSGSNTSNAGDGLYTCSPSLDNELNLEIWNDVFAKAGKLNGTQENIVALSREKGIDPVLFASIAIHETGWGKSNAIRNKNNPGGLMGKDGLMNFDTLYDGLRAMANTLYNRIIRDGLITIEDLGAVYAPVGADNDPNNLNVNWVPNITEIAEQLGGFTMNCILADAIEVDGDTAWPVPHTKNITSSYGVRSTGMHHGIDIAGGNDKGKPIVAYTGGVVVVSKFGLSGSGYGGYGNVIVIDHGNGLKTLYAHLNSMLVEEGDVIRAGKVIGTMGNTGNVRSSGGGDGTHLHFEVRLNDKPVNPMPYLKYHF